MLSWVKQRDRVILLSLVHTVGLNLSISRWNVGRQQVVKAYMKPDRVFIDLVKEGTVKASKDVEHIGIPCHWTRCVDAVGTHLVRGARSLYW